MKQVIHEEGARPIKIWTDEVEDKSLTQLKNLSRLPFIHPHGVVAMPDIHYGAGTSVGTVIATRKAIIPSAVGVDVGCGVCAVQTTLNASDLPESLSALRHQIERDVPTGNGFHSRERDMQLDLIPAMTDRQKGILEGVAGASRFERKIKEQLATLGSGNHFIEITLDENDQVWVMLHSGSRGIGNIFANKYIELAKKEMRKWFIDLPDEDLAYLPAESELFGEYISGMMWCQEYASANRLGMINRVVQALNRMIKPCQIVNEAINNHHNYTVQENHFSENIWITRKGAVSARENQLGIIPASMGQKSYIVKGKGNPASYCSCSHGAGRRMSRTQATKEFTVADLEEQTKGVECRKDSAILDEIPSAYKNMDQVMANQVDLIEVVHTLKPVLCVKGA